MRPIFLVTGCNLLPDASHCVNRYHAIRRNKLINEFDEREM